MIEIVFATNNAHKLHEVKEMLKDLPYRILSLNDIGFQEEVEETGNSFEANALLKAKAVYDFIQKPVFSEDSGLEVEALDGRPGIHTARYAGPENDNEKNMAKLLAEMNGIDNRRAQFQSCICYFDEVQHEFFTGICKGNITKEKSGEGGFGYDPIFIPEGYNETFASFSDDTKNSISHRKRAIDKFCTWLEQQSSSLQ